MRYVVSILTMAALLCLAPLATGCQSGVPLHAYAYSPENVYAGTNANVLVLVAQAEGAAGLVPYPIEGATLEAALEQIHYAGPAHATVGTVYVWRRNPEFNKRYRLGEPLPTWVQPYIHPFAIEDFGLTFADPDPVEDEPPVPKETTT